jgi:hypothetical protein
MSEFSRRSRDARAPHIALANGSMHAVRLEIPNDFCLNVMPEGQGL